MELPFVRWTLKQNLQIAILKPRHYNWSVCEQSLQHLIVLLSLVFSEEVGEVNHPVFCDLSEEKRLLSVYTIAA